MSVVAIGLGILFAGVYVGTFVVGGGLEQARNWYFFFAAVSFLLFVMLRVDTCLMIFFAYLSVEGMLKLLTNYNPIVHIGADIILFFILVRWAGNKIITGEPFERVPYFGLIALHSFWIVIQVLNPYSIGLIPSLGSFKVHLTMIPLYFGLLPHEERSGPQGAHRSSVPPWLCRVGHGDATIHPGSCQRSLARADRSGEALAIR